VKLESFRHALEHATADLELDAAAVGRMVRHWELLGTWNRRINLTAIADPEDAAWLHYRDSLEAMRFLPGGSIADMGSGGGFPGIPLAIAMSDRSFTLIEPRRKRASFLAIAIARLGLDNARVLETRSDAPPTLSFAAIVTRATFSRETDLVACLDWLEPGGLLVAYRGTVAEPLQVGEPYRYELAGTSRSLQIVRT
jgi:16S rRNA (guanine527-N7)-methyltransferase